MSLRTNRYPTVSAKPLRSSTFLTCATFIFFYFFIIFVVAATNSRTFSSSISAQMSSFNTNSSLLFVENNRSRLPKLDSLPFSPTTPVNQPLAPHPLPPLSPRVQSLPPLRIPEQPADSRNNKRHSGFHESLPHSHDSLIQRLRDFTTSSSTALPKPTHDLSRHNAVLPPLHLPPLSPISPVLKATQSPSLENLSSPTDRPHACRKCNATFRRRDNLMAHFRAQHKGERPFRCAVCDFRFIKKDHAMKHWKVVHLKERPFVCNKCDSRFGQRSDLNKHVRSVHLRIKPFQCEHCGLKFSHRGNQIRHQAVVHDKKKPFACSYCTFTFAEKSNLLKHCQAVHKTAVAHSVPSKDAPHVYPMGFPTSSSNGYV